ncbi:MAG TPA: D-aminoacyl-tRNA deacylase [Roseiflexaceae bacterium]|nr:D-aminoacyl-tRNA deacylase [Roseiflexaceae bacterium]
MKAVIQRVSQASVTVGGEVVGKIGRGLLVLLGVGTGDERNDALFLADKLANMRIFSDHEGRFNLSVLDINGEVLAISQFTLYADTRRGRRPSFSDAARPEIAAPLVDTFVEALRGHGLVVASGVFGAHMLVDLQNDGPVTILLDSATFREPRRTH